MLSPCRSAADADHAQNLRHEAEKDTARIEALRQRLDEELRFNERLKALGVDLTQYLCVREQKEPDHHIRLEGGASAGSLASGVAPAQLHLELRK